MNITTKILKFLTRFTFKNSIYAETYFYPSPPTCNEILPKFTVFQLRLRDDTKNGSKLIFNISVVSRGVLKRPKEEIFPADSFLVSRQARSVRANKASPSSRKANIFVLLLLGFVFCFCFLDVKFAILDPRYPLPPTVRSWKNSASQACFANRASGNNLKIVWVVWVTIKETSKNFL